MKNIRKMLKRKNGEGYIDVAVTIMVVAFVLIFTINIASAVATHQNLKTAADQISEYACANGTTNVDAFISEVRQRTGLNFSYSFSGSQTMDSSGKVQLGDKIIVTLTLHTNIKGFDDFRKPIALRVTGTGLSQVYWK